MEEINPQSFAGACQKMPFVGLVCKTPKSSLGECLNEHNHNRGIHLRPTGVSAGSWSASGVVCLLCSLCFLDVYSKAGTSTDFYSVRTASTTRPSSVTAMLSNGTRSVPQAWSARRWLVERTRSDYGNTYCLHSLQIC